MRDSEVWLDLLHRFQGAFTDVVPPEAQVHLLNAQRELLTALVIVYEHKAGSRRSHREPEARESPRRRPSGPDRGSQRISVD